MPLVVAAVLFVVLADPFMAIGDGHDYLPDPAVNPVRMHPNKGMVTVRNYKRNVAEGRHYNAFIFGSSISCAYPADVWAALLRKTYGGNPEVYHMDSSCQSFETMYLMARWLERQGASIDYALIVTDAVQVQNTARDGYVFVDPPELHPESAWKRFMFYFRMFRAVTSIDFLKTWLPWVVSGNPTCYSHNAIFEKQPIVYDRLHNQERIPAWEAWLDVDPEGFRNHYPIRPADEQDDPQKPLLTGSRLETVRDLAALFRDHGTHVTIIISPNRGRMILHPDDLATLRGLFGEDNVKDYSIVEAERVIDDTAMYDFVHYRPTLAVRWMKMAYGEEL